MLAVDRFDWVLNLDVDEMVRLPQLDGTGLAGVLARHGASSPPKRGDADAEGCESSDALFFPLIPLASSNCVHSRNTSVAKSCPEHHSFARRAARDPAFRRQMLDGGTPEVGWKAIWRPR